MSHDRALEDLDRRREAALAMGGPERLAKRAASGVLNARERIDRLFDPGTFIESGLLARPPYPRDRGAHARRRQDRRLRRIDGRDVARRRQRLHRDGRIVERDQQEEDRAHEARRRRARHAARLPRRVVRRAPARQHGRARHGQPARQRPQQYLRARESPWVSAALGLCYGSSTWYCVLSDFNVMRKGAIVAVSSSLLASLAMNDTVDAEELGGWRVHAEMTGFADQVVDTDEEALDAIKTFLSYLPGHHHEAPPRRAGARRVGRAVRARSCASCPESRTQVYDMRKVLQRIVDKETYFELKARFGKAAVTALARLGGRTVGIIANNPLFKGGALDADACDKIVSFLVLCDSFNMPIVMFVDTPGFAIGIEAERKRAPGKIMNFMNALTLVTVPKLTVIVRKSYGQAYINMGGGRNSDEFVAWPTAEVSFMDPSYAVTVVNGLKPGDPGFEEKKATMEKDNSVYDIASIYAVQDVIRPEQTRDYLIRMLDVHQLRRSRRNRQTSAGDLADVVLTRERRK